MRLANSYAIFALGALPQLCAGQGSLRDPRGLARMPTDADQDALSYEDLFQEPPQSAVRSDHGGRRVQALQRQNAMKAVPVEDKIDTLDKSVTDLKEELKANKIELEKETANDNKQQVALQAIEGLSVGIKQIQDCAKDKSCSGKEVADTVFALLGTVGFVVGVSFPPAGAVIAIVSALGSLVASFFGDAPVRALPGLDAAAVESAAFRAVQSYHDTGAFAQFKDFEQVLRVATKFNSNTLIKLETASKEGTESQVIDKIVDRWFEQYHNFKWESMGDRLKDVGKEYYKTYGDIQGSRRKKFVDWMKDSKTTCKLEKYLQTNQKGRDNLNKCKENMADAKTDFDYVKSFGTGYIKVATMLVAYWTSAVSILTKHSTCGDNIGEIQAKYNIHFEALRDDVTELMFKHAEALKTTLKALPETCETPKPNSNLWPWNQQCEDWPGKCHYQFLVLSTETDQIAAVNKCEGGGCKMLIEEEYDESDIRDMCQKVVDRSKNEGKEAFFGGIIGWEKDQSAKPKGGTCSDAAAKANNGVNNDISMFAIPSYTVDIAECEALFKAGKNFGLVAGDPASALTEADGTATDGDTPAPTPAPTSCPKDLYSIQGYSGNDGACWEEEVEACTTDSALKKMGGNHYKAAQKENWSSGWSSSSGGNWNDGVQKKGCASRAFDSDEKVKCFWDLNNGCLYD